MNWHSAFYLASLVFAVHGAESSSSLGFPCESVGPAFCCAPKLLAVCGGYCGPICNDLPKLDKQQPQQPQQPGQATPPNIPTPPPTPVPTGAGPTPAPTVPQPPTPAPATPAPATPAPTPKPKLTDAQANEKFRQCCQQKLGAEATPGCLSLCTYQVTQDQLQTAVLTGTCALGSIGKTVPCASGGKDNSACCTGKAVASAGAICGDLCKANPPPLGAEHLVCAPKLTDIMKCHRDGLDATKRR